MRHGPPRHQRLVRRTQQATDATAVAVLTMLAATACSDSAGPPEESTPHFAIHLPAEPQTKIADWFGNDLDSLELSVAPWLTDDDLEMYDFSGHVMYLKEMRANFLDYSTTSRGRSSTLGAIARFSWSRTAHLHTPATFVARCPLPRCTSCRKLAISATGCFRRSPFSSNGVGCFGMTTISARTSGCGLP